MKNQYNAVWKFTVIQLNVTGHQSQLQDYHNKYEEPIQCSVEVHSYTNNVTGHQSQLQDYHNKYEEPIQCSVEVQCYTIKCDSAPVPATRLSQ